MSTPPLPLPAREGPVPDGSGPEGPPPAGARCATPPNQTVAVAAPGEFRPLALGPLRVWPPVVLAPMAGVTNRVFRSLCREQGAGLYVSEMITARGFLAGNRLTTLLAGSQPDERPRSVQVYGSDPVDLGEMTRALVDDGVDHLDLNLGCPVPKVTRCGGGAAIPVKPRLVARLVRSMVLSAGAVPVSVKMRTGIDAARPTYPAAARAAEAEGAAAVGLHARTAAQLYSGQADWEAIGELSALLSVPVLGNGDVWECWDALRMMRATGCAGVIVGRGCLGRPWIFRELARVFDGREPEPPPDLAGVLALMLDHARGLVDLFGPRAGVRQMRKWTGWYTRGFRGAAALRGRLARVETVDEIEALVSTLDLTQPFPMAGLRASRAKGSGTQRVRLPEGYLDDPLDDTPPAGPHTPEEIEAWERALSGG